MYAIQTGDKFLSVRYFLDPVNVFDTAITGKPKGWKTQEEAETHLSRARAYFAAHVAHMNKIKAEAELRASRAVNCVNKLKAELEVLIERPYKEVHAEVDRKLKELNKREADSKHERNCAQDYARTAKKFEKLLAAEYRVVNVKQVVDAVAV